MMRKFVHRMGYIGGSNRKKGYYEVIREKKPDM